MRKTLIIIGFVILGLITVRSMLLKKPGTEILYKVKKENLVETIQVSGTFNKTASDEEKALAYVNYQNSLSALKTSQQNKLVADATMWTKQKALLDTQNSVNYKNDNTINLSTKKDYTELEKYSVDSALTQAQKDFTASEAKYKEADIAINAANAQVALTKIAYDDALVDEPVLVANINEVYLPLISVDQKATIVFDALNKKSLIGNIKSIDNVGTIKGGIVTYEVKIGLEEIPPEVKPNMTAIVTIETLRKNNIFLVPNSAIILKDGKKYVQQADNQKKELKEVITGITGLAKTEILSGLTESTTIIADPK